MSTEIEQLKVQIRALENRLGPDWSDYYVKHRSHTHGNRRCGYTQAQAEEYCRQNKDHVWGCERTHDGNRGWW